jgi:hypothetical protein
VLLAFYTTKLNIRRILNWLFVMDLQNTEIRYTTLLSCSGSDAGRTEHPLRIFGARERPATNPAAQSRYFSQLPPPPHQLLQPRISPPPPPRKECWRCESVSHSTRRYQNLLRASFAQWRIMFNIRLLAFFWVMTPRRLVDTNVSEKKVSPSSGLKMDLPIHLWVYTAS